MTGVFASDAREILGMDDHRFYQTLAEASRLRERRHGRSVNLCWIVNAKSGRCDQDCGFCSQSSRSRADIDKYPLIETARIVEAAKEAAAAGAVRFSIVTAGGAVKPGADLDRIVGAVREITRDVGVEVCASLGCVDEGVLRTLKDAGMTRYHHNMETAESYWRMVCSTRPYEDSRRVVKAAKEVGLEICSGGIFGMGESLDQRVELLQEIRALDVDSVALNFFVPIKGTPFGEIPPITPMECLRVIVAARLMMPRKEIRVCGGRERNIRELQSMILPAGASGLMIGGYLTTSGRTPQTDLEMIRDLGYEPDTMPDGRTTITDIKKEND